MAWQNGILEQPPHSKVNTPVSSKIASIGTVFGATSVVEQGTS